MNSLHQKALSLAEKYLSSEKELIETLKEIFLKKVFVQLGYSSMHDYASRGLGLSDDKAYTLTRIAKVCVQVPELEEALQESGLSVTNARTILPVLTKENSREMIQSALELPKRELERKLVQNFPDRMIQEKVKPVTENRSELRAGISHELAKKLERVREVVSQKTKKPCSLEEAIAQMAELYLRTQDPLQKAERSKKLVPVPKSRILPRTVPAHTRHSIWMRDHGQCQAKRPDGSLCGSRQFLEMHHIRPWGLGGNHAEDNLELRCWAHHKQAHANVTNSGWDRQTSRRHRVR